MTEITEILRDHFLFSVGLPCALPVACTFYIVLYCALLRLLRRCEVTSLETGETEEGAETKHPPPLNLPLSSSGALNVNV